MKEKLETPVAQEETAIKKRRGRPPKTDFSVEEVQEKFSMLFNAIAFTTRVEREYNPGEFYEEAKDVTRLSQKYPVVAIVLTWLDPLFLVLNLTKKGFELVKLYRKRLDDAKTAVVNAAKSGNRYPELVKTGKHGVEHEPD